MVGLTFLLNFSARAQSFNPVFQQNSVDGMLLGAEGSLKLFGFLEPHLALAYGFQSQKMRYQAGLELWGFKLSALDWPGTPVLGRVGQSGLQASLKPKESLPTVTGFLGTLWPWVQNELPPTIAYLTWSSARSFSLPFNIALGFSSRTLYGLWRLGANPLSFQYSQTTLSLSREGLSLGFSYGTLENEGKLPDFEFVQSVKGDISSIKGDRFWALRFERRFDLLEISLSLPPMPVINRPIFEKILVEGAAFLQTGATTTSPEAQPENLLSWGLSFIISLDGMKIRADLVFKRDGEYRLLFGS